MNSSSNACLLARSCSVLTSGTPANILCQRLVRGLGKMALSCRLFEVRIFQAELGVPFLGIEVVHYTVLQE